MMDWTGVLPVARERPVLSVAPTLPQKFAKKSRSMIRFLIATH
jgi:hypothetical protein